MASAPSTAHDPATSAVDPHRIWWTQVRGQSYGPYLAAQIRQYLREGRLKPQSLIGLSQTGPWAAIAETPAFNGRAAEATPSGPATIIIYGDIMSGAVDAFDEMIASFGDYARIGPDCWVLKTVHPLPAIRAGLANVVQVGDRFMTVDATRGRIAWHNLGLAPDVRLRELWCEPQRG